MAQFPRLVSIGATQFTWSRKRKSLGRGIFLDPSKSLGEIRSSEIQLDARRLVTHGRIAEAEHQRVMLAEHRPPRVQRAPRPDPHPEEQAIVTAAPELADYVVGLKQRSCKVVTLALRQLLRLVREYPREPLLGAVREAGRYGLYDLDRLERMILRRVTREYFLLDRESDDD